MLSSQSALFPDEVHHGPPGLHFLPEYFSSSGAGEWLAMVEALDLVEARYKQYTARRRVASFGGRFDYEAMELREAPPIPPSFAGLIDGVAQRFGVGASCFTHMLVAEYPAGTPLGWHRDVPDFESIVGLSLLGTATLKFRPYPPRPGERAPAMQLELPPGSLYLIEGEARWRWQHSVAPTRERRISVTLRTRRGAPLLWSG